MAIDTVEAGWNTFAAQAVRELIFRRRSIRKYKPQPLPEEWIRCLLRCAHQAPSPSNRQPVRYVRIESSRCRDLLQQALADGHKALLEHHSSVGGAAHLRNRINVYRRYADIMFSAPHLLAVGVDTQSAGLADHLAAGGLKVQGRYPCADMQITVGLALQGLMLKAQAMGVGSCILTTPLVFIDDAAQLLGLHKMRINCFLTLGLPDETPPAPQRMPLNDAIRVI